MFCSLFHSTFPLGHDPNNEVDTTSIQLLLSDTIQTTKSTLLPFNFSSQTRSKQRSRHYFHSTSPLGHDPNNEVDTTSIQLLLSDTIQTTKSTLLPFNFSSRTRSKQRSRHYFHSTSPLGHDPNNEVDTTSIQLLLSDTIQTTKSTLLPFNFSSRTRSKQRSRHYFHSTSPLGHDPNNEVDTTSIQLLLSDTIQTTKSTLLPFNFSSRTRSKQRSRHYFHSTSPLGHDPNNEVDTTSIQLLLSDTIQTTKSTLLPFNFSSRTRSKQRSRHYFHSTSPLGHDPNNEVDTTSIQLLLSDTIQTTKSTLLICQHCNCPCVVHYCTKTTIPRMRLLI